MEQENDNKVTLISSDSQKFEISVKGAMLSELIKERIQNNKDDHIEFNANQVRGEVLKKVVEYLEHYKEEKPKEIQKPLPSSDLKDCVDEWDYNFINIELNDVFEIILASNYLNIQPLLNLCSTAIAVKIKGKSTAEIRQILNITNDFSPEEEQQIIEENKWCMENL